MTKPPRHPRSAPRLLLAAAAGALVLLAAGVAPAAAAPAASQQATSNCWLQVINDWLYNNQVDKVYAIPCYTQAIQHLNAYPDVAGYSSAVDDINRALQSAIHQERNSGPPTGGAGGSGGGGSGAGGSGGGGGGGTGGGTGGGIWHSITPGNAQSIPLPLLVLGGLALLLLLTAAATWLARRLQARRMTPAPAIAPAGPKRR